MAALPKEGLATPTAVPEQRIRIATSAFAFVCDTSRGLRAVSWTNQLSGKTLDLGLSPEVEIDVDTAAMRIPITGWRCWRFENESTEYAAHDYRDAAWQGRTTPIPIVPDVGNEWARTHVVIPESARGRPLALTIGGCGVYDFGLSRVYLNGHPVGERHARRRWNGFAQIPLPANMVRYGGDNVIALQSREEITRTPELDAFDPDGAWSIEQKSTWPYFFEQYVTVGQPLATPDLTVTDVRRQAGVVIVDLTSASPRLEVTVTYRWEPRGTVLCRELRVRNSGDSDVRLMDMRLGTYRAGRSVTNGDIGMPVVIDDDRFVGLAHPAGWAIGQDCVARLLQFPGAKLAPGQAYQAFDAVYGVARSGGAQAAFRDYLQSHMRRTRRGHDRPYAIYESFASWPGEDFFGCSEETVTRQIEAMERFTAETGCRFDIFSIEFWHDPQGDLSQADPVRFPRGLAPIAERLGQGGARLGLWYDTQQARWNIVENPLSHRALNYDEAYGTVDIPGFCRATEPFPTLYAKAFAHHTRVNGVRLFKMDGMLALCGNPTHDHLPGVYSIEANDNAIIANLRQLDEACPEAFVMLYWGSRSPWWLLHADTIFDAGLAMEGASPSSEPTLYVRDSVNVGLDQALRYCEFVPPLGKDSLGVWLSDWGWNSCIGSERWQEGFIMDIARGNLLAQPWAGLDQLPPEGLRQMAQFIEILRAHPDCFKGSRLILGDPRRHEVYGYLCPGGDRAFIALNNATWADATVQLDLGAGWGLRDTDWHVYRWYPRPARLTRGRAVTLRPFEVALLEAVAPGQAPSLGAEFAVADEGAIQAEAARELAVEMKPAPASEEGTRAWDLACTVPATATGGTGHMAVTLRRGGRAWPVGDIGTLIRGTAADAATPRPQPVVRERSYPAAWQGWRFKLAPSEAPRTLRLRVVARVPSDVDVGCQGHFVPK